MGVTGPADGTAAASGGVRLRLLGEPALLRGAAERTEGTAATPAEIPLERRTAALLAYLAVEGPCSREKLATLLWPGTHADRARANLRQCLLRLRRLDSQLLQERRGALALAAAHDLDTPLSAAEDGVLLGSFSYGGCPRLDAWLERQRAARAARMRSHWLEAAQQAHDSGHFEAAVALMERALAADASSEEPYRRLMQWHYLRGDRVAALATWDRCMETLRRSYGSALSAETQQLGRSIRAAVQPARAQTPAIPVTLLRPPKSVGRQRELTQLHQAWDQGHAFIVEGESGMGKSRLLEDFSAARAATARATARPGDRLEPYSTLARLVSALDGALLAGFDVDTRGECARLLPGATRHAPDALRTDADRARFTQAVHHWLAAAHEGGIEGVLIDDLQFADGASLAMLGRTMDGLRSRGLRFGVFTRKSGVAPEARQFLGDLAAQRELTRVDLSVLTQTQVQELLGDLLLEGLQPLQWSQPLTRHSGGNPGFLLESLKTLYVEQQLERVSEPLPVPQSVAAAIDWRLQQLTPAALSLAQLTAITGVDLNAALAADVLGCPPAALLPLYQELEHAQILRGTAFAHDLLQDAVLRGVPSAIRSYLHAALAERLQAAQAPPGRVATHWSAAQNWERAAPCWMAAARQAEAASQPLVQVELLDQAVASCVACKDQAGEFQALLAIALTETHPDYGARAPSSLERMRLLAGSAPERLELQLTETLWAINQGLYARSEGHARAALLLAQELALPDKEVVARARLAWTLVYLGRPADGLEVLQQGVGANLSHPQVHDAERALYYQALAMACSGAGRLREAIAAAAESVASAEAAGHLGIAFDSVLTRGVMHAWHGEAREAARLLKASMALRARLGEVRGVGAAAEAQLGYALRELGDYGAARQLLDTALRDFQRGNLPAWVAKVENDIAETCLLVGDVRGAQSALAPLAPGLAPTAIAARLLTEARVLRAVHGSGDRRVAERLERATAALRKTANVRATLPIAIEQAREALPDRAAVQKLGELSDAAARAELMGLALYAGTLALRGAHHHAGMARPDQRALHTRLSGWLARYEPTVVTRAEVQEALQG
ncbi:MAG: AAA family ATPase [Steroidobacteraceae bacterium]